MAIYCRKSLLQYAEQEQHNIFEFNKKGVEFYEGIFNLDYPFGKLDTIFCPEYTVGSDGVHPGCSDLRPMICSCLRTTNTA
jgi:aminopeptidase N